MEQGFLQARERDEELRREINERFEALRREMDERFKALRVKWNGGETECTDEV
jgi:hypothetical protein